MLPRQSQQTAWAYLVVSSEQQAETLTFQERWAKETAGQHGWILTEMFQGVSSGRDGTRALLKKLLARLEDKPRSERPYRVLMIRLDRLGRGLGLEALAALAQITELGVTIHTRQDGDYKIARASDAILPLMRIVTGGIENEARRDKALYAYKMRRESGRVVGTKRPYGVALVDGRDVPMEPAAGAVRLAFELAANGFGYNAIGTRLQAIAAPKTYRNGRSHETDWTRSRVRMLLRCESYRGVVIDAELYDRVRRLLDHAPDTRVRTNPWPLSGALHCSCGRLLIGSLRGSPPRRVYRCTAVATHKGHRTFAALTLERRFVELLKMLSASPKLLKEFATKKPIALALDHAGMRASRAGAIERIKENEIERARIWRLNSDGLLPDVHLAQRLNQIDEAISALKSTISEIDLELQRSVDVQRESDEAENLLREAASIWESSEAADCAAAARALARSLHGFCVVADGSLQIGPPTEPARFFRPTAS